ncbi:MAG: hypothetical protein BECKG1743D_GA0114223_111621 [Candidatus Kentron sp. G]|nr:MAG: hypothetical protein BECKG1743D_GA0114223_111621 [Candidatus Kentron sp. G]
MEIFQKFSLTLSIVMLGLWGISLIIIPDEISVLISKDPVNHTFAGMMGAALLGLSLISLASITQWIHPRRALGIAVLLLVVESAYLMLATEAMVVTAATSMSIVAAATIAFFLLI